MQKTRDLVQSMPPKQHNTIPAPKAQGTSRQKTVRVENQEVCCGVPTSNDREATLMIPQQYSSLNKT